MNKPRYIDWLVEEKGLVVQGGHEMRSYRIDYHKTVAKSMYLAFARSEK